MSLQSGKTINATLDEIQSELPVQSKTPALGSVCRMLKCVFDERTTSMADQPGFYEILRGEVASIKAARKVEPGERRLGEANAVAVRFHNNLGVMVGVDNENNFKVSPLDSGDSTSRLFDTVVTPSPHRILETLCKVASSGDFKKTNACARAQEEIEMLSRIGR